MHTSTPTNSSQSARGTIIPAPSLLYTAKEAIATLAQTERYAADEVERGGGNRSARLSLPIARENATRAVLELAASAPDPRMRRRLEEFAIGCREGSARDTWAILVMRVAQGEMR